MELEEWKETYDQSLEDRIEQYTLESEAEIVKPNPLQSREQQLTAFKLNLQNILDSEDAGKEMRHALEILNKQMPQSIPKDTWDLIQKEFSSCEENLLSYLEAHQESHKDEFVPIYQMYGFSVPTLIHCYEFGQSLYNKKSYGDAKSVMLFLIRLSPLMPEFWIAAGMCEKQMGRHQEAIQLFQLAQTIFPDQASLHIYCADNYLAINDKSHARIELEGAKEIFTLNPLSQDQWRATYDFLWEKAK